MKSLRTLALMLAIAAVSLSAKQSFGQQEIAPDHFDQPIAAKAAAKAPAHKITAQHHANAKANVASKQGKQHRSHATA